MNTTFRLAVTLFLALLVAACGSRAERSPREQALYEYQSAIRWSEYDVAMTYLDPLQLASDPVDPLELERLKQYQVAGYTVRSASHPADGSYEQVVEISLVNRHTQVERVITDRQRWRWDQIAQRWWLMSGLPVVPAN
ncbi:hypothetical protein [Arenimonas composti]|uniref:DUF4136 domain-containing protein n=1 Tax=Arenimonas composti TR7-09 = DSM 18010 TaxID=1121013 RepID=A0A091BIM0_9GAMM|nr:hypothetical protein [Arenimonas composti]KFN50634.1 hypothetical protein P873_05595 [Arenimonas composti TR7-09 = DSM 18010]